MAGSMDCTFPFASLPFCFCRTCSNADLCLISKVGQSYPCFYDMWDNARVSMTRSLAWYIFVVLIARALVFVALSVLACVQACRGSEPDVQYNAVPQHDAYGGGYEGQGDYYEQQGYQAA